jgi:hypothetical protein
MVTAKYHGHQLRGLRQRQQGGEIAEANHGLEEDDLEPTAQVATVLYSLASLSAQEERKSERSREDHYKLGRLPIGLPQVQNSICPAICLSSIVCNQPGQKLNYKLKNRGCDNVLPGQGCRTLQG